MYPDMALGEWPTWYTVTLYKVAQKERIFFEMGTSRESEGRRPHGQNGRNVVPTRWSHSPHGKGFDDSCLTNVSATRSLAFWRCPLAPMLTRFICLRFLSLGSPQIKSLHLKTSYSRRSESFHSQRNCNCATRNISKCDAELWGEAPPVCTARRTPSFLYNFL